MKYLLDTNMCIYAQKQNPSVLRHFKEHLKDGLAVSVITVGELEYGIAKSFYPDKTRLRVEQFLTSVEILPLTREAMTVYGRICASLEKKGTPIGKMDMLIAAHALSQNLIIVTNNVREFERVENLKIENWYEP